MENKEKLRLLKELVLKRRLPLAGTRAAGYSKDYQKLGDFHQGMYDFDDHVVPWSKTACNYDADLMLIAQDWASADFLIKPFDKAQATLGYAAYLPSNKNLFSLLSDILRINFENVYATDMFVFVKPGDMGTRIPLSDLRKCAVDYALPQIRIIKPKIVVCIGSRVYNALRFVQRLSYCSIAESSKIEPFYIDNIPIFGVTHVGGRGASTVGGKKGLIEQWQRISRYLDDFKVHKNQ